MSDLNSGIPERFQTVDRFKRMVKTDDGFGFKEGVWAEEFDDLIVVTTNYRNLLDEIYRGGYLDQSPEQKRRVEMLLVAYDSGDSESQGDGLDEYYAACARASHKGAEHKAVTDVLL